MDVMVLQVQQWLNMTYTGRTGYTPVTEDGLTGWSTVTALITALQIEEGIASPNGNFGPTTTSLCPTLSINSDSTNITTKNEIYILQGSLYCKGYNPNGFDGGFGLGTESAIKAFKTDAGLVNPDGVATPMIFKALMNMDAFVLVSGGDPKIRTVQQNLNRDYNSVIGLMPCDGIYSRSTNTALIKALQTEEAITADGVWGPTTQSKCPVLNVGSTKTKFIYLLQYALYCNHFDPNGFDGYYGNGAKTAVTNFQSFSALTADGIAGPQTWASLLVSTGDKNRKGTACDCATTVTTAKALSLKNNGYRVVGRYLTGTYQMTVSELETIFAQGLSVFPIYERNSTYTAYFTEAKGTSDAKAAILAASNLGFAPNTIIYFAVDYDALDGEVTSNIIPYFKGIYNEFNRLGTPRYRIGIYGARNICSRVAAAGYSVSSFVGDMSTGFSGNLGYTLPTDWAFDQISTITVGTDTGAIEIDNDICSGRDMGASSINPPCYISDPIDDPEVSILKMEEMVTTDENGNDLDWAPNCLSNWVTIVSALIATGQEYSHYYSPTVNIEKIGRFIKVQKYNGAQWINITKFEVREGMFPQNIEYFKYFDSHAGFVEGLATKFNVIVGAISIIVDVGTDWKMEFDEAAAENRPVDWHRVWALTLFDVADDVIATLLGIIIGAVVGEAGTPLGALLGGVLGGIGGYIFSKLTTQASVKDRAIEYLTDLFERMWPDSNQAYVQQTSLVCGGADPDPFLMLA